MEKKTSRRTNKVDLQGARRLVLALAVSSTLGFWALFSKVNPDPVNNLDNSLQATDILSSMQDTNQLIWQLPPMPTLVPPIDPTGLTVEAPPVGIPETISQPEPFVPVPGTVYFGGAAFTPGQKEPNARAPRKPVTTTRSSR